MSPTMQVARASLIRIVRSRFFWAWNLGALALASTLNFITYFDFEGTSFTDLFFSTLVLSGAVNALVFHVDPGNEFGARPWDLLLTRPIRPLEVVLGRFLGLVCFQTIASAVLLGAHLFQSALSHRLAVGAIFFEWFFVVLEIAMLCATFGLLAVTLSRFWAFVLMVGVFLAGHLSPNFQLGWPSWSSAASSLIFCIIPDLDRSILGGGEGVPKILASIIVWQGVYAITFIAAVTYVTSMFLPRVVTRR